jgi:hypothetical protein
VIHQISSYLYTPQTTAGRGTKYRLAADPGISGYTVASKMNWSIRTKSWMDFPVSQKWFAIAEAAVLPHRNF